MRVGMAAGRFVGGIAATDSVPRSGSRHPRGGGGVEPRAQRDLGAEGSVALSSM